MDEAFAVALQWLQCSAVAFQWLQCCAVQWFAVAVQVRMNCV